MEYSKEWAGIVEIFQRTKTLILTAEEYSVNWNDFLQPYLEHRSALDHICRAMAVETGIKKGENGQEVRKHLDKAKGHSYRAFFDAADWISTQLRGLIIDELQDYDSDCINTAIPDYYSEIRPDINDINTKIAETRKNKDITSKTGTIDQVKEYIRLIDKLFDYYDKIIKAKGSLEELKNEQQRKAEELKNAQKRKTWIQIFIPIVAAVIGAILGVILS